LKLDFALTYRDDVREAGKTKLRADQIGKVDDNLRISIRGGIPLYGISHSQIAALERSRKIEELQKRLVESEMLRTRYNRKLTMAKEQMRTAVETADQERSINDHSLQLLRDELAQVKQSLSEVTRRESQVRRSVTPRRLTRRAFYL
jgi:hypothetical protein